MPEDIVTIDLTTETGSPAKPTYNDMVVIGRAQSAPDPGFNNPQPYSNVSNVATDFGTGSDVHVASQRVAAKGAEEWHVVVLEETETTEVIGDSDSQSVTEGQLSETNLAGNFLPTITVDGGNPLNTIPKAETPPNATTTPEEGEAFINMETGYVASGSASDGTGDGIEATFHTLSWNEAFAELEPLGLDGASLADVRVGREHIGDLSQLWAFGSDTEMAVIYALKDGDTYPSDQEAMTAAHQIGKYIPGGGVLPAAHKSSDDVGSELLGQLAVNEPWFDPMWDGDGYSVETNLYRKSLVGDPNQRGTFEGGDTDGAGPTNVLIRKQGVLVLSNSLSTAGEGSDYRYFDVWRTEAFIASEVERALESLRLRKDHIGFDKWGRPEIIDAIRTALAPYKGGRDKPLVNVEIDVPRREQISEEYRNGRIWGPIGITGELAQNAHSFEVNLAAQL